MKATQILMDEHRVIERVIAALERAAQQLQDSVPVRSGFFLDAADFIRGFADGCHHHKEEGVLFQSMLAAGAPAQGGPVQVMLAEHEQGRAYTRGMREAAQKVQSGDDTARTEIVKNALGYVSLLRDHIRKEDGILFPMADRLIPLSLQDGVIDGFERVEHEETGEGVHEKYLALAEKLEQEAARSG